MVVKMYLTKPTAWTLQYLLSIIGMVGWEEGRPIELENNFLRAFYC